MKVMDQPMAVLEDIFQWDVRSWSRALPIWSAQVAHLAEPGRVALAVGEREGGLSLWLARLGLHVHCTDLHGPSPQAHLLHRRYDVERMVNYDAQDITALTYPDGMFDVVMFKSVIGALASKERQRSAMQELKRVLKPGGSLLFAENLSGTWLHRWLRKRFIRWDRYWRYLRWPGDADLLDGFTVVRTARFGFIANLGRTEFQRRILSRLDDLLLPVIPGSWRYILVVTATKPTTADA